MKLTRRRFRLIQILIQPDPIRRCGIVGQKCVQIAVAIIIGHSKAHPQPTPTARPAKVPVSNRRIFTLNHHLDVAPTLSLEHVWLAVLIEIEEGRHEAHIEVEIICTLFFDCTKITRAVIQ